MSRSDSSALVKAHVSRLFFERGLAKREIAARLGISRFKVARLLDQARQEGIVRIEVHDPLPLADELGRKLEQAFGLELALVARDEEALPQVAAAWLSQLLGPDDVLGVAFGSTIQRVVRALPADARPSVPVVQICGAIAGVGSGEGPLELAWQFAERLGGAFYALPVPAFVGAVRDEILRNEAVAPTVAMFERVTVALVGIGSFAGEGRSALRSSGYLRPEELPALRAAGAVGDLLVHVFAADGSLLETDLAGRAVSLSAEQLRRVRRVLAVAGGPGKAEAIAGALRTGLIDLLVTDEANAARVPA